MGMPSDEAFQARDLEELLFRHPDCGDGLEFGAESAITADRNFSKMGIEPVF